MRTLLAVFGVFNVSIVLQFVRFHSGNVKKTLLRPRFSSASTLLFSQHLDFNLSLYNGHFFCIWRYPKL